MVDESSQWNENWQGKQKYSEKPSPVPLCPPQIAHDLTWDRTWAAADVQMLVTSYIYIGRLIEMVK
jgi:hypothetical protein